MKNWCKILDGIAWSLDEQDNMIWGHDTSMDADEINEQIEKRIRKHLH